ncbi:MAG: glycoside hydrolase family 16 protein [Clostridia bacterium]|nr:glycoside hydrolase family 16 protein [Clostridia bacterium]
MLEQFFTYFKFAFRQRAAFLDALETLKQLLTFKVPFTKITATVLAIMEMFTAAFFDTPRTPRGPKLDLTGYELVFEDQFDGDSLDTDVWSYYLAGSEDQISFRDGNLVMKGEYKTEGARGENWYAADIGLNQLYCKGYYEIRCKVFRNTSRRDLWSAFWITLNGEELNADISKGGPGGCEIDVYESFSDSSRELDYPVGITPAMWCNGIDDDPNTIDGRNFGQWYSNDPVNEYNTYGVLWTDDYYIWYINGVEAMRSDYGNGISEVPEQVRVTLCLPSCAVENMTRTKDMSGEYIVDYVRIYQLAD